ncbi:MAG: hypothetical protein ACQETM_10560 [Bacteroidota bacterium]
MSERQETDLPLAIEEWGWKFHHLGIPTKNVAPDEKYLPDLKFSTQGFKDNPFGVEWMRFDEDCRLPEIIKTQPHLAFVVDDLEFELSSRGFSVIVEPNAPSDSVRVAMIEYKGAPIELMEMGMK